MVLPGQLKTRRHLALLFCVPVGFSMLFFLANQFGDHSDLGLLELENLSSSITRLLSVAKDVETGERGYLLTGNRAFLAPYEQGTASLPTQIDLARTFSKDLPEFRADVEQIIELARVRCALATDVVREQQQERLAEALDLVRAGGGQETMLKLRDKSNALTKRLREREEVDLDRKASLNRLTFGFFLLGTVVMLIVLGWLYQNLIHYIDEHEGSQAQLRSLNAELEQRIDERTRELKEMNEELQQFAYVASHDLQEPLRTITSFTQLLAARYKGKLDEDADEFIGYIVTSSRRMTDLINGLLALVRLRKTGLPTTPIAFEDLLRDAELGLQAAIRESGAQIVHGPLPTLVVDKLQITQLLQNLISNAIKYRREERPVIHIEARREASNWVVSVRDNGQGFDQQYAERIFAIFQRLHGREVEGTGMGLSIARKIVERHGGRIWAESAPGEGSTFHFSLPASLETTRDNLEQKTDRPAVAVKAGS